MGCGCKNKQSSSSSSTRQVPQRQRMSNPLNNGNAVVGGRRIEKRIIR